MPIMDRSDTWLEHATESYCCNAWVARGGWVSQLTSTSTVAASIGKRGKRGGHLCLPLTYLGQALADLAAKSAGCDRASVHNFSRAPGPGQIQVAASLLHKVSGLSVNHCAVVAVAHPSQVSSLVHCALMSKYSMYHDRR